MKRIFTVLVLTAVLSMSAENLVKNHNFEKGGNWWYNAKSFSIAKVNGNRVFRIQSAAGGPAVFAEQTPAIPVKPEQNYVFTCRYNGKPQTGVVYMMFLIRNQEKKCIKFFTAPSIKEDSKGTWKEFKYTFTTPAKTADLQIRIYAGKDFTGSILLDDLVLQENTVKE